MYNGDGSGMTFTDFMTKHLAVSETGVRTAAGVFVASIEHALTSENFAQHARLKGDEMLASMTDGSVTAFLVVKQKEDGRKWGSKPNLAFHRVILPNRGGNLEF